MQITERRGEGCVPKLSAWRRSYGAAQGCRKYFKGCTAFRVEKSGRQLVLRGETNCRAVYRVAFPSKTTVGALAQASCNKVTARDD